MEKRTYYKISYENCEDAVEYDYTICELEDVAANVEAGSCMWNLQEWEEDESPSIIITPILLTEEEFDEERKEWDI